MKEEDLNKVIKDLLYYSFDPINWKFEELTETEKSIIKDEDTFNELKQYVDRIN
jgi:hypothetical protein